MTAPGDIRVDKPVFSDGLEPVTWHGMGQILYAEIIHSFMASCVVDLTCVEPEFALAALKTKTPFIGVAAGSDDHSQGVAEFPSFRIRGWCRMQ